MQSLSIAVLVRILYGLACLMPLREPVAHATREFSESIEGGDRAMEAVSGNGVEVWGTVRTGLAVVSYVAIFLGYMLGGI